MSARSVRMGPAAVAPEWICDQARVPITAMLLALTHTLIANPAARCQTFSRYCTGFERACAPMSWGESDGQPKDADWRRRSPVSPPNHSRCWPAAWRQTAPCISASWSLQRADHGEQALLGGAVAASCLGQIRLAGLRLRLRLRLRSGIAEPPPAFARRAWRLRLIRSTAPFRQRGSRNACCTPASLTTSMAATATYPDIKLVYWAAAIRSNHHQDTNQLRSAFRRPQNRHRARTVWTATARHADIVLPATTTLERNDIGFRATRTRSCSPWTKPSSRSRGAQRLFDLWPRWGEAARLRRRLHPRPRRDAWLRHLYDGWRDSVRTNQARHSGLRSFLDRRAILRSRRAPTNTFMFEKFRADL